MKPFVHESLPGRVVFAVGAVDRVGLAVVEVGGTNQRPIDVPSMRALLQDASDGRRP